MTYQHLQLERPAAHVARIVLSRPDSANALSAALLDELFDAVADIERDNDVRVWLLSGAPRRDGRPCFSAGVDMKEALSGPVSRRTDPAELVNRIDDMLKPSIAVIAGTCTTGALELALACDLRVAGYSARISDCPRGTPSGGPSSPRRSWAWSYGRSGTPQPASTKTTRPALDPGT